MKQKPTPKSPALLCPRCLSTCTEPVPGVGRCRVCRWTGPIEQTREEFVMRNALLTVTDASLVAANPAEREKGLLGYLAITVNGRLRIEGLALRRTMTGRISVSFPEKRDSSGRPIHLVRPLDADTQRSLERQILEILAYEAPTSRD